ncbi:hypothetical protein [Corynebacterium epidermidicanis]|uniref:hypothetical protein n=1 Tax=Corynebacterium epidermidicanis TaxID=1050174 RepID=UPI0011876301|nr:hypothetical protein [Corynebacterium epidermidicanis]
MAETHHRAMHYETCVLFLACLLSLDGKDASRLLEYLPDEKMAHTGLAVIHDAMSTAAGTSGRMTSEEVNRVLLAAGALQNNTTMQAWLQVIAPPGHVVVAGFHQARQLAESAAESYYRMQVADTFRFDQPTPFTAPLEELDGMAKVRIDLLRDAWPSKFRDKRKEAAA